MVKQVVSIAVIGQKLDDLKEFSKDQFDDIKTKIDAIENRVHGNMTDISNLKEFKGDHEKIHRLDEKRKQTSTEMTFKTAGLLIGITSLLTTMLFFVLERVIP